MRKGFVDSTSHRYDLIFIVKKSVWSCSCHLFLHACNRSVFARELSIDSRAYVISQHARWPIRAALPTCANQDARVVVITPKRPKANSIHTAVRHAWTRTPFLNIVQEAVFFLIHFSASFIHLWPLCHSDLGGSRHGWGLFLEQTKYLQSLPSFSAIRARLCTGPQHKHEKYPKT